MKYEIELARSFMTSSRNKRHYHPHIWLSILGIAVGVCFLTFALSIYDGYVKKIETIIFSFYPQITLQYDPPLSIDEDFEIDDKWLREKNSEAMCADVCGGNIILEDHTREENGSHKKNNFPMDAFPPLEAKLRSIKGIKQVSPIIFEEAQFGYSSENTRVPVSTEGPLRILGVRQRQGKFVPEINRTITSQSVLNKLRDPDTDYAVISEELYKKLFKQLPINGKPVHKTIRLWPIKEDHDDGLQPPVTRLIVAGTFKLGMHKISENMIITSLQTAQKLFKMDRQATFLGIVLDDPYQADLIADIIKRETVGNDILVYQWMAIAADMFNSLSFYRKIIIIVLLMSIIITAFNIHTTLNIMILERKRQIGILTSMGIKNASLHIIFLIISQKEAVIGILIGIFSGVGLGYYFSEYFQRSLEAFLAVQDAGTLLRPGTVAFIFTFVCLICGLTSYAATRKGVRLDPVDALRSE